MNNKYYNHNYYLILIILACWLISQIFLNFYFYPSGFEVIGGDHKRFLVLSNYLLSLFEFLDQDQMQFDKNFFNLSSFQSKSLNYLGYGSIISTFKLIFRQDLFSLKMLVYFQIAISLFSGICLFYLINLYSNKFIAFFSSVFYLSYPPLQMWNLFVLSDSLALSLTIIFISLFFIKNIKTFKYLVFFILLSFLIASLRPHAWILPLSFLTYLFISMRKNKNYFSILIIIFFSFLTMYLIFNRMFEQENKWHNTYNNNLSFVEFIVWHDECIETDKNLFKYKCIKINELSKDNFLNNMKHYPLYSFVILVLSEPIHFIKVSFWRIFWELAKVRPSYSDFVNLFYLCTLVPIYFFAIVGIFRTYITKNYNPMILFFSILCMYNILFVSLTFAGFSARFSIILYPFIFYLSFNGLQYFLKKFSQIKNF